LDFAIFNLKDRYLQLLNWLTEHPDLSYWIFFFSLAFGTLFLIYLIITNLRLHFHIRSLNRDKQRLMEEKDLMRMGHEKRKLPEKA
jgi:hypothetical protein